MTMCLDTTRKCNRFRPRINAPPPVGHSDTHWIPQWGGAGPRSRLHHEVPAPRPRAAAHRAQNVVSRKRRQRERRISRAAARYGGQKFCRAEETHLSVKVSHASRHWWGCVKKYPAVKYYSLGKINDWSLVHIFNSEQVLTVRAPKSNLTPNTWSEDGSKATITVAL